MKEKLKSHKTVEQIAKKHRLDVDFIQKQLEMGEPIEHEHTKDHDLARDIALQHLDEIPDYYTRLKKMESDAKKHHKKFKDVPVKEDLRNWFSKSHPEGNWKRYNTKGEAIGPCAREPGEPKPKCLSNEKAAKMSKSERAAAVKRKRKSDPVANREGKGGKPIMVSNKINEEDMEQWNDVPMHMKYEKRYCPKCKKEEHRHECRYGTKCWDTYSVPTDLSPKNFNLSSMNYSEEKDHEYSMSRSELSTIANAVKRLRKKLGSGEGNIEAWVQSKITKAADYLDSAADYIDSGEHNVEEQKDPCWTGYKQVGMKKKGKKMVPNCVPVNESIVAKILDEIEGEDQLLKLEEENKPTNPELWARAKSLAKKKFDVYPSAYANGWASKWYKSKGGGWKSVKEDIDIQEATLKTQRGNVVDATLYWRGKYYSLKIFFPQAKLPSRKDVSDELQKVYPGCNVIHHSVSDIQPGQPLIQALGPQGGSSAKVGPNKNYVKPMGEEVEFDEDWQKVNRQDKTDGLSQKAVDAYRRENPGSKLQTAVTEKNPTGKRADRRKSFCRRMKGMKSKLTSSETARDPDSRINKALRRWNCN